MLRPGCRPRPLPAALAALSLAVLAACGGGNDDAPAVAAASTPAARPLVIAHRGASGYLPEHTLEAYAKAIEMGADFIEPDLVSTKDGVLIARHEPMLDATTDVAERPEFASRRRTLKVDGIDTTAFFASDFTLAEIRTLRAKQAFAERDPSHNGRYQVPTFEEVIALAKSRSAALGRTIGVYPETKHPTWHEEQGLPLEDRLLAALAAAGWTSADAPVFIQSFEQANLKKLRAKTRVRLVQLVDADDVDPRTGAITYAAPYDRPYDWTKSGRSGSFGDLLTPAGLDEVRTYADAIGPWKRYLVTVKATLDAGGNPVDVNADGQVNEADFRAVADDTIVRNAHARGLKVHTWTFRNEPRRLAASYANDPAKEYAQFFAIGVDGVFSDFPDTAVAARDAWVAAQK
ncbi:glycerophosphodiester phosphodiesterase [Caldimonas tepidiphila]|uniref:glycerophosphodiester phosphodiesterase n=1 Tax=Caldimonas tepidiphila TaxID=2315841 RepID=UPI000E5B57A5|nr:glycerophosphodiester phosphodiesterase [Caldimonas tepidiphila]